MRNGTRSTDVITTFVARAQQQVCVKPLFVLIIITYFINSPVAAVQLSSAHYYFSCQHSEHLHLSGRRASCGAKTQNELRQQDDIHRIRHRQAEIAAVQTARIVRLRQRLWRDIWAYAFQLG